MKEHKVMIYLLESLPSPLNRPRTLGHISKLVYKVSFLHDLTVAGTNFPRRLIVMMVSLFLGGFNL